MTMMKTLRSLAVAAAILGVSPLAAAETTTEQAKQVVTDFYGIAFGAHDPVRASRTYLGSIYIQHNSRVPNGAAAFEGYFTRVFQQNPSASSSIKRVIADGDLVAIHSHSRLNPEDPGRAIVDIFRVEDGKIVEHWDVIQDVPAMSANGNTMFDGNNTN